VTRLTTTYKNFQNSLSDLLRFGTKKGKFGERKTESNFRFNLLTKCNF